MEKIMRDIFSGRIPRVLVTFCFLFLWMTATIRGVQSLDRRQFLNQNSDVTEFFKLLDTNPNLLASLKYKRGTLFVPTNQAIKEFNERNRGKIDNTTLTYHFCNIPIHTNNLDDMVTADLQGNPPIWVTKVITRSGTKIFLNDAQIVKSNLELELEEKQIIHIIDGVLEPSAPVASNAPADLMNPDARKFLENSASYTISKEFELSQFALRVAKLGKLDEFRTLGRHTFFIPVDAAFKPTGTSIGSVDAKVIDGHVIIGKAIFLRSAELERPFETYQTSAAAANFPVFVSFSKKKYNGVDTWSVSSENKIGNVASHHRAGTVHSVVLKGNIPVKNGVVHLISQPLVLIDSPIYKVLKTYYDSKSKLDEKTGPMSGFLDLIDNYARDHSDNEIQNLLNGNEKITVFVPTSEALRNSSKLEHLKSNVTMLKDIIRLHIVKGEIRAENITHGSKNEITPYQAETIRKDRKLYFNVIRGDNGGETIFVEGGGTNASIVQPDIGATNGVIHLINRLFGVEDQSIFEKLESDPMLQLTYRLTNQDAYNENFRKSEKRFTFFAPSNLAWDNVKYKYPSEHLKLFHGTFGYQVGKVFDRHLIVRDELTIEQLRDLSVAVAERSIYEFPIRTLNGGFRVFNVNDKNYTEMERRYTSDPPRKTSTVSGDYNYVVFWDNKKAFVVRPNIKCTNGIIHILDQVLMTADDVYVNSVKNFHYDSILSLLTFFVFFLGSRILFH